MLGRKLSTLLHSEIGIFTALDLRLMTYKPEPNAGTGLHRLRDLKNEKPGAGACQKSSAPCTTLHAKDTVLIFIEQGGKLMKTDGPEK